jgi:hypothetical protein
MDEVLLKYGMPAVEMLGQINVMLVILQWLK